jgi:hypothetical protein
MAQSLKSKGNIGIIYHAADFFVTKQRFDAFKKTITTEYPGIKIVAEQGIGGPDFAGDAEKAASALLTRYANLARRTSPSSKNGRARLRSRRIRARLILRRCSRHCSSLAWPSRMSSSTRPSNNRVLESALRRD